MWWWKRKPKYDVSPPKGHDGKAFLWAVNKYKSAPLRGCVNDSINCNKLLIEHYGFSPNQIHILLDGDATKRNIMKEMDWFVDVKPGNPAFLGNSCHGAQIPLRTPSASEPDGLAECVCPVEFDWSPDHSICDKEFVQILSRIPQGVAFNWISDSCHAGDLSKSMPPPRNMVQRAWYNLFGGFAPQSMKTMPTPLVVEYAIRRARKAGHSPRAIVSGILDVGFVSGCRSDQTSADTEVGGVPCGALTYYLLKNIRAMPRTATLAELVAITTKDLTAYGYTQRPQVEGARSNRPFLAL